MCAKIKSWNLLLERLKFLEKDYPVSSPSFRRIRKRDVQTLCFGIRGSKKQRRWVISMTMATKTWSALSRDSFPSEKCYRNWWKIYFTFHWKFLASFWQIYARSSGLFSWPTFFLAISGKFTRLFSWRSRNPRKMRWVCNRSLSKPAYKSPSETRSAQVEKFELSSLNKSLL